jgi:L-fucose isomerase-like protein
MRKYDEIPRFLIDEQPSHLQYPVARLQPVQAKAGKPNIDVVRLQQMLKDVAILDEMIAIQSPEHWQGTISALDDSTDAILPVSIPAYPTEVWNSHPQVLVERGLPVVFWSLLDYEEPDFWRWAACDMLHTLGVDVHLVRNSREGIALLKALALKRFLSTSRMVVFGEQNFPWNAHAVGDRLTRRLGTEIIVHPLEDMRARYPKFSADDIQHVRATRLLHRYEEQGVQAEALDQAIRTYLAIREILEEERALGFGVNCFGDLIIRGGRDVPCLAQLLLREEGYIAACDGDFIAMTGMALSNFFLNKPTMMSNLYPVSYVGALTDHFGDPLSPGEGYPRSGWHNFARLAHCGYVGVVSPEMTPSGKTTLRSWGGTYEIKRDGRGCGVDGELAAGEPITVISLTSDMRRLMIAQACVAETTRYPQLPHCEASALLEFRDLIGFTEAVSRDHVVILYGDHQRDFEILAGVLGLEAKIF